MAKILWILIRELLRAILHEILRALLDEKQPRLKTMPGRNAY